MKIRCYTLHDITKTGINTRREPMDKPADWQQKRNQQSNFETIIQIINLRTQPEDVSDPEVQQQIPAENPSLGRAYERVTDSVPFWTFTFTVSHGSIFNDGRDELGLLHQDCNGVPMINNLTAWDKIPEYLDVTEEYKNIYFEIVDEQESA